MKSTQVLLTVSIILFSTLLLAQNIQMRNITGQIVGHANRPIPNTMVYIEGNGQQSYTTTDKFGNFKFKMLPGIYTISFEKIPEFNLSPSSFRVDTKNGDKMGITSNLTLSNKGKKDIEKSKKLLDEAIKAGIQVSEAILTVGTKHGGLPIAAVLYGDPTLAFPPGIKVYYGTGFAIVINGKVVFGDKNTRIIDPDYGY